MKEETTITKPCGCTETQYGNSGRICYILGASCEEHIEERRNKEAEDMAESRMVAEPLNCESCGQLIGYVGAFDLNSSHFYCPNCKD